MKALVALKKRFPFVLVLDEAHGTGIFGPNGGGLAEEMGVLPEIDILVGTQFFFLKLLKEWKLLINEYKIDKNRIK